MKKVRCATYEGVDAKVVDVESTLTKGLPSFSIVGMASTAITESKERVKSALLSNEFSFPPKRITFLLAPSELAKSGSQFDLSMAVLILLNESDVDLSRWFVFGELGLDGSVKENIQLYPLILSLANQGLISQAIVPFESLQKLSKIPNVSFYGVKSLKEAVEILKNQETALPNIKQSEINYPHYEIDAQKYYYVKEYSEDFIDVKGQDVAKRAALIAAAGFHNIILEGSPGCGKSMIANRLRYILPPMTASEILDVAKLEVLEGYEPEFKPHRALKNPHHSSTPASIFGGGSHKAKIGEVGLANNGILFFDELPHFSKAVLESLREPMQDAKIRISRVNSKVEYPAKFLFVGAMNPCPCGNLLDLHKECRCSDLEIQKYKNRLSEPFLDRIDLNVVMQNVNANDCASFSSKEMHKMVVEAHIFCKKRGQREFNAHLQDKDLDTFCRMDNESYETLQTAIGRFSLSFRSIKKIQKVARTIADLHKSELIQKEHLLEALSYRRR
ncbi:YifB family Mg chelatase-like AAA ATPase [Sulfurimonas autotrophica]|uniref:Sigma 54 interacting domain protein n=1 Tax=Sulfurimonas autotrophica (strain ATCC BAA-671 / DSM 16294 / JCM 11897 / OK10) TaxID=563040 RepID=E0US64_SULAO|nr:YifB family Mg chelatase-like AAA ATPase [Sulfurimonas autotrophica]ADN10157.1 Sigma 54 interacting domain protein [Sulfurimonas autotrophica DSM 16294]